MNDTSLIRMTIKELAKQKGVSLADALEIFYRSDICKDLSYRESGLFTYTPRSLAEMILE